MPFDEPTVRDLCAVYSFTLAQLAEVYGLSPAHVQRYLTRWGIQLTLGRPTVRRPHPDLLRHLRDTRRWPPYRVAAFFGVTERTVHLHDKGNPRAADFLLRYLDTHP